MLNNRGRFKFAQSWTNGLMMSVALMALPSLGLTQGQKAAKASPEIASKSQALTKLRIDTRTQVTPLEFGTIKQGSHISPKGETIGINNRYLTLNDRPWFPIMGEIHYSRLPREEWETELLRMKSMGIDIVAFYVIWMHHEENSGEFNFKDDRDLKYFVELCARHNLKAFIRIGPWVHAEVRNGGTPQWVVDQMPKRQNDADYLEKVERFWAQIAQQVKGQFWKDGGPIIGVQLENEYNLTGPGKGEAHIATLKAMALKLGMDAPLYTVTGWDGTVYPQGEVAPVFGGYLDEPWGLDVTKMAPNEVYNFRFKGRVAGDAGAQTPATTKGTAVIDEARTPFLGAEYAGGLPIMYRRRPLVTPDDVGAMLPVQLGSGVNLYGYYMFHGGRNPKGHTWLEENAHLGGYNDVPLINYDFQSAYGQYNQVNPILWAMKPYHLFIRAFGERLAPMPVFAPDVVPKDRKDFSTPRLSVRANGNSGFVFMSNYLRQYPLTTKTGVQFNIERSSGSLSFPSQPITIETGAYFIWPYGFDLDGTELIYASAQPLTRIETQPNAVTYVFVAQEKIAPEFAFSNKDAKQIISASKSIKGDLTLIRPIPSTQIAAKIVRKDKTISVMVVTQQQAQSLWQGMIGGKERLILSQSDLHFTPTGHEIALRRHARI